MLDRKQLVFSKHSRFSFVKKKWRNKIAGVVHIDGTSRVQTLNKAQNKDYYEVINKFYSITKK